MGVEVFESNHPGYRGRCSTILSCLGMKGPDEFTIAIALQDRTGISWKVEPLGRNAFIVSQKMDCIKFLISRFDGRDQKQC